jgi:hypothetical protein
MPNIVPSLRQELAALDAELRADPRYRKIERIRALLSEYGDEEPQAASVAHQPPANLWRRRSAPSDSKKERVRAVIRETLAAEGSAHRSALLKTLMDRGIMGQEKDPMGSLAAYLSDFKDVKNTGGGRWTLEPPQGEDASHAPLAS